MRLTAAKQEVNYEKMKREREMICKLPFRFELEFPQKPSVIKMFIERLNETRFPDDRDYRKQIYFYRIVMRKADTNAARKVEAALEIKIENLL